MNNGDNACASLTRLNSVTVKFSNGYVCCEFRCCISEDELIGLQNPFRLIVYVTSSVSVVV